LKWFVKIAFILILSTKQSKLNYSIGDGLNIGTGMFIKTDLTRPRGLCRNALTHALLTSSSSSLTSLGALWMLIGKG